MRNRMREEADALAEQHSLGNPRKYNPPSILQGIVRSVGGRIWILVLTNAFIALLLLLAGRLPLGTTLLILTLNIGIDCLIVTPGLKKVLERRPRCYSRHFLYEYGLLWIEWDGRRSIGHELIRWREIAAVEQTYSIIASSTGSFSESHVCIKTYSINIESVLEMGLTR